MADRMNQYPMLSGFPNNPLLQQQQAHQQQQQQQQQQIQHQPQDQHPAMSQSQIDQARAWGSIQQFRPQDMNGASAQFAEMLKRTQSQGQAHPARQQQQQQQPFAMGSGLSQMNPGPPVIGGSAQQPPFHDPSSSHPAAFQNMGGMPQGNPNQPRNPPNILGFQPSSVSRQLELMNMAQNQQPQNGPVNINKFNPQQVPQHQLNQMREREQQQQQQFQSAGMNPAAELFSSPAMSNEALRRPSPHPTVQPPGPQQQAHDLPTRAGMLRNYLAQTEIALRGMQQQLSVVRGGPQEHQLVAKIQDIQADMSRKKELLGRMLVALNTQKAKAVENANGGPSGANQQPWISHPQPFEGNPQPSSSQLHPNQIQSSPSLAPSQSQASHLVTQGFVPQRSGPTPQHAGPSQHTASPFNSLPQSMAGQFPFVANNQPPAAGPSQPNQLPMGASQGGNVMSNFGNMPNLNLGMIAPLDKPRFESAYRNFCSKRALKPDARALTIESRQVDLHRLHVEVMKEGGAQKVEQRDIWNIIGGRLGFVQFPGTDTDPAKAGPGVAQQLSNIYKEYLALFEQWYTAQALENSRRTGLPPGQFNPAAGVRPTAFQMQQFVGMSQLSVAELKARGADEKMIQFVEQNRASLQRSYQEQKTFHNKMRTVVQPSGLPAQMSDHAGPQIPRAPVIGPSASFSGSTPGQHTAAAAMARQQYFQQQQLLQQGQQQPQQPAIQGGLMQDPRMPSQQGMQNGPPRIPASLEMVMKYKQEYAANSIPNMRPVEVPVEHRLEFNQVLEHLYRQCSDAEQKLQMLIALVKQEEVIKRMVVIICTAQAQRTMLSTVSNPRYIVAFETLKNMSAEMTRIMDYFNTSVNVLRQRTIASQMQGQGVQGPVPVQAPSLAGTSSIAPPMPVMGMQDMGSQNRPPVAQLPMPAGVPTQQQRQLPPTLQPPPVLQPPPLKRKQPQVAASSNNAASSPSPAPASTPAANAATPTATASSPPAVPTKSPKTRAPPKPKAAPKRRPSKATPASAATPEAAQPAASSSTPSSKRPREEDSPLPAVEASGSTSSAPANEPSPPKRVKTEWESPPTEEMKKKDEVVENIKSEDDATTFFVEQMTDFIKNAGDEGQSGLTSGISETLDLLLKAYGSVPDGTDGGALMGGETSGSSLKEATPPPGASTDFDEFFDFSFGFAEDDDPSKAPTPDLVSSSSANPSPESNHESDVAHHMFSSNGSSSTSDVKTEDTVDSLRLGPWKNIDGGEGAYYQTNEWKWDSPMSSLDQPWAIFNS